MKLNIPTNKSGGSINMSIYLAENLLVELVITRPELEHVDRELTRAANYPDMNYDQFVHETKFAAGKYFSSETQDKLDWEYVAAHWWNGREVPVFPESDLRNYKYYDVDNSASKSEFTIPVGTFYLAGRI